jgi:GGDEF domain-containing protein
MWCLCRDLRTSDLIASDGKSDFRILLTTPDAENAKAIAARIEHFTDGLNDEHSGDGEPLALQVVMEPVAKLTREKGPCDPCEEAELRKLGLGE